MEDIDASTDLTGHVSSDEDTELTRPNSAISQPRRDRVQRMWELVEDFFEGAMIEAAVEEDGLHLSRGEARQIGGHVRRHVIRRMVYDTFSGLE